MDRFSALNLGRIDSLAGVGQSQTGKSPGLASFLAQRANQVLGSQQSPASAVETRLPESPAASVAPEESTSVDPRLARQMEQMQRLHSSISLPAGGHQGISVLV